MSNPKLGQPFPSGVLGLLAKRRFAAYFLTQFLGAFNDNVFKQGLIIFITFEVATRDSAHSAQLVTVAAAIFILPFLICSPIAGQLADKFDKTRLMRQVKLAEIFIMLAGAGAFWLQSLPLLLAVLFLMGAQSSLFGPVKYGIVPQLVSAAELAPANGLVQAATYIAILTGGIVGGLLMAEVGVGWHGVAAAVVIVAMLGFAVSLLVPTIGAADPELVFDWNIIRQGLHAVGFAREDRSLFCAIIGISWFWFLGATYLQLLPSFGKDVMGGDARVVVLLLTAFSVGIGTGAIICGRRGRTKPIASLISIGATGMAGFGAVPWLLSLSPTSTVFPTGTRSATQVLSDAASWPLFGSFVGLAICGGMYVVPLVVHLQRRSPPKRRARIFAANNMLNAIFMVSSALMTIALLQLGLALAELLALAAALSIPVSIYLRPLFNGSLAK